MEITLQHDIDRFNSAFRSYLDFTSKQPQEALERKVGNIGLRLFKGFQEHQFGGVPRNRTVAQAELEARTSQGAGTKVRPALMNRYLAAREGLIAERRELRRQRKSEVKAERSAFGSSFKGDTAASGALEANAARSRELWQATVESEVKARQSGVGELGAAFLWFRFRGKGEARRLVANRAGRPIGIVTVGKGEAEIVGDVAGLTVVDGRYGIVSKAINDETDDTLEYIKKKLEEEARKL